MKLQITIYEFKENRIEQIVRHYLKYTILIIDEIGYLRIDKETAYAFFQLVAIKILKETISLNY